MLDEPDLLFWQLFAVHVKHHAAVNWQQHKKIQMKSNKTKTGYVEIPATLHFLPQLLIKPAITKNT